jgi:hypothetical protein
MNDGNDPKGLPWTILRFCPEVEGQDGGNIRPHWTTDELEGAIEDDIRRRYSSRVCERAVMPYLNVTHGGIHPAHGCWAYFEAMGYYFGCSAFDFPSIHRLLSKSWPERVAGDHTYVKVHFYFASVCLPADLRRAILKEMDRNTKVVSAIGAAEARGLGRGWREHPRIHGSVLSRIEERALDGGGERDQREEP